MVDRYYSPQPWPPQGDGAGWYDAYDPAGYPAPQASPPHYGAEPAPYHEAQPQWTAVYPEAGGDGPAPGYEARIYILQDSGQPWRRTRSPRAAQQRLTIGQTLGVSLLVLSATAGTVACAYYVLSCFGFY